MNEVQCIAMLEEVIKANMETGDTFKRSFKTLGVPKESDRCLDRCLLVSSQHIHRGGLGQ
jgi:hypothetical protein